MAAIAKGNRDMRFIAQQHTQSLLPEDEFSLKQKHSFGEHLVFSYSAFFWRDDENIFDFTLTSSNERRMETPRLERVVTLTK